MVSASGLCPAAPISSTSSKAVSRSPHRPKALIIVWYTTCRGCTPCRVGAGCAAGRTREDVTDLVGAEVVPPQLFPEPPGLLQPQPRVGPQGAAVEEVGEDAHVPGQLPGPELVVQLEGPGGVAGLAARVDEDPVVGLLRLHRLLLHLLQDLRGTAEVTEGLRLYFRLISKMVSDTRIAQVA